MKSPSPFARLLLASGLWVAAAGCFSPHTVATRRFVLASATPTGAAPATNMRLGVRVVGMPGYLNSESLAIRVSAIEIRYLETALWAERLDHGFERVLAADLSAMIPTERVRLGAWRTDDVALEVHVRVEQFDVDLHGHGNLVAEWRITSPGDGKVLKNGTARLTKSGKPLAGDAQNLVTTLSELATDFSRTLTEAIKDIPPQ
jgi:uncharacterized protein